MQFYKKKYFVVFVSLLLVLVLSALNYKTGASLVYFNGTVRKLPIYSVDRQDDKISISFDCAYGADYTNELLDVLDTYNVKCTFFMVEFWVKTFPEMVVEIKKRGHDIGTHSKTHPNMSKLSRAQIKSELESSINAIITLTGEPVTLFRPPYGDYDNDVIDVASELNLYTIQWDVDSLDWKDLSASEISSRVINKTKSGSIILCHNNGLHTAKALPTILSTLKGNGFEFVPISELIYKQNYTIDSFGVQHEKG